MSWRMHSGWDNAGAKALVTVDHLLPADHPALAYEFTHAATIAGLWPEPFYSPDTAPKNNRFHGISKAEAESIYGNSPEFYQRISKETGKVSKNLGRLDKSHNCSVYLIRDTRADAIKIGSAVDVASRLCGLQIGNASLLAIYKTYRGTSILEGYLQKVCEAWRIRGEWYQSQAVKMVEDVMIKLNNPFDWQQLVSLPDITEEHAWLRKNRSAIRA